MEISEEQFAQNGNRHIEKYRRVKNDPKAGRSRPKGDKLLNKNIVIKPAPAVRREGKISKVCLGSMRELEKYAEECKLEQVMNVCNEFTFDTEQVSIGRLMVIIARRVSFQRGVSFTRGLKKNQLRVLCSKIDQFDEHAHIDRNCAKDVFFYEVPDQVSILPLD